MKVGNKNLILICALTLGLPGAAVFAEQQVYGSQLMSQQERMEHRTKMQNMKTMQERERYRMEHHKMMQERAKEKGVTLPDEPSMRNKGMGGGQGNGMGGGMGGGQGGGMGR